MSGEPKITINGIELSEGEAASIPALINSASINRCADTLAFFRDCPANLDPLVVKVLSGFVLKLEGLHQPAAPAERVRPDEA